MSWDAFAPLWLTMRLALYSTLILCVLGTGLAWWLTRTKSRVKPVIEAITALPLVLPPTVIGFYFLILMSPNSAIGGAFLSITGHTLTFSFVGLIFASMLYSLPFMVQPLQASFDTIGNAPLEAAASLGAGPIDRFFTIVVPLALRGYLTALTLTFAHTLGEFGVVLMVGGNIPGETRVISIAIYEHVETLNYGAAHMLSGTLLGIAFVTLVIVFTVNRRFPMGLK